MLKNTKNFLEKWNKEQKIQAVETVCIFFGCVGVVDLRNSIDAIIICEKVWSWLYKIEKQPDYGCKR